MKAIFVGGELNGIEVDADLIELVIPGFTGNYTKSWSDEWNKGLCVPRPELWNRPIIKGYLSPMWDGGKLRYETQEVYDMMSN